MQKFKIFYSWQSDLPGNRTRSFIRECIDEAIELAQESETVEAERDEATKGVTGSPDIVATLFSKIDNCDLFIADLSLCFTGNSKMEKKSPNPNVLLELGYAVKNMGWERIICLCNTDYGDSYPFDIAHNRITSFSLEGKSKKEVKGDIAKIIFTNIRDIRKLPIRAKSGAVAHIIGAYDFKSREVTSTLVPIEIGEQKQYVQHNKRLLDEASTLMIDIQELTETIKVTVKGETAPCNELEEQPIYDIKVPIQLQDVTQAKDAYYRTLEMPVVWDNMEKDKSQIKHWLGVDVTNDFFDMNGLKKIIQGANNFNLIGTPDEKLKYDKLLKLSYDLMLLDIRTSYVNTFQGMYFFPLAIQNISGKQDSNIRVVVEIEIGEIVEPNKNLICEECQGLQGYLCRDDDDKNDIGIIAELFSLPEDGFIHIEDIPNDQFQYMPKLPIYNGYGFSQPDKTDEDYKQELKEFIASTSGCGYYEFDIENLRPGECRWLCYGILIKPINNEVKIHYQIHSTCSMGDLSGILEMKN